MKYLPYIVTLCLLGILLCAWFMFVKHVEDSTELRVQRKEIKHLQEVNEQQELKFLEIVKLKDDTIAIAFNTIRELSLEKQKSDERLGKLNTNHEKIVFTVPANDSLRMREWTNLYPSLRNR